MKKDSFFLLCYICKTRKQELWKQRIRDFESLFSTIQHPYQDFTHEELFSTTNASIGFRVFRLELDNYNMFWYLSEAADIFDAYFTWQMYRKDANSMEQIYQYSEGF